MFIQHKQLESLNVAAGKVAHLHSAASSVQLAFTGYPPQLCRAYLLKVLGGSKVLIMVAFYLAESQCSIFFVPKFGKLPAEDVKEVYEEGYNFIESMGFILTETDYHLLSEQKKQLYLTTLPICQPPIKNPTEKPAVAAKAEDEMKNLRSRSLKSLGQLFASM